MAGEILQKVVLIPEKIACKPRYYFRCPNDVPMTWAG